LRQLESLSLHGDYDLTALEALGDLNELRSLSLGCDRAGLRDAAIVHVCRCAALDSLSLFDLRLADPGTLRGLTQLPQLFSLVLDGEFPTEGREAITELDGLDMLNLWSPSLTNDGVHRLADSPRSAF
jgi:hypothetical protein